MITEGHINKDVILTFLRRKNDRMPDQSGAGTRPAVLLQGNMVYLVSFSKLR